MFSALLITGILAPVPIATGTCNSESLPLTISGKAEITDGDSLQVDGYIIRLAGIDAPERHRVCFDAQGLIHRCGQQASDHLAQLTAQLPVSCELTQCDRYGRWLGYCESGERDINLSMVSDGYACALTRYTDRYGHNERVAYDAQKGIWQYLGVSKHTSGEACSRYITGVAEL